MLQIRLLGQFDVRADGKRVTIPSRAAQSLFAYLALSAGKTHRREKLAGIFWPETSDEHGRKSLRQELWRIRKAIPAPRDIGSDYLISDEFTVGFDREADYWLDAEEVQKPELDLQALISNVSHYHGELLPGFYEEWILLERDRIRSVFDARMEQLTDQLVAAQRWSAVQEQSERWLSLGNVPEAAYRALMLSYGARGNIAQVSSVYRRCVADLHEQFDVEPSAETQALYEGLLKGSQAPVQVTAPKSPGAVTFVFTDIEGSTQLLDRLGADYAAVLTQHHEILRKAIAEFNGHEVDTQGDAFFITFAQAFDAAHFAVETQRRLASHQWPQGEVVRVRMGLHTGEPMITSTGYVGVDVHRAARIGDSGHGGQVLLSDATRQLVANDLPASVTVRELGDYRLKDMKFPVPIYQLVIDGLPAEFPPLRIKLTGSEPPAPGEPPFKGLQFYDEADKDLFFGREALTAKLVQRLEERIPLAVIVGASGSGKSSLVRAGVIPAIRGAEDPARPVPASDGAMAWQVRVLTPSAHPLEALAAELGRDLPVAERAGLQRDLADDPRSLRHYLSRPRSTSSASAPPTVLVIDQFEELFTLCRDEFEREAFIDNLLMARESLPEQGKGPAYELAIFITLRADFYAHLAQYPNLRDAAAEQQEYIGPMTSDELRRAIEEPAHVGHWQFEAGLVDLILRDLGEEPGGLPLLSHALLETWKRRAAYTLTLKGYADAGGVRGAIAHTAETVYLALSPNEQTIARNLFLRLTELGEGTEDTRRRASFIELTSHSDEPLEVRAVLNKLADARLVTLGNETAEVAHEALIREWPALREWLSQDREGLRLHRRLTGAAHEWNVLGRDPGALHRGAQLAQAREWAALNSGAINAEERDFLNASLESERQEEADREAQRQRELEAAQRLAVSERESGVRLRRRNRIITLVGSLGLVAAVAAALFGARARTTAAANAQLTDRNAVIAVTAQAASTQAIANADSAQANFTRAEAQRLAALANGLLLEQTNADVAALLSVRAMDLQYSPQADAALEWAMAQAFPRLILKGHTGFINSAVFSPDGKYVVTASADLTARLWDAASGKELRQFVSHTDWVEDVAYSPDGKYVVTSSDDSTVRLWDAATGKQLRQFAGTTDRTFHVLFSPDGKYVLSGSRDGTVHLWETETGTLVRVFKQNSPVRGLAYSPDGRFILTGSKESVARLWDVATGTIVREYQHPTTAERVAFSPDGRYVLTAGGDKVLRLFDFNSGNLLRSFSGHTSQINAITVSPDSRYALSCAEDGTARLWDLEAGTQVRVLTGHGSWIWACAFSPDGKSIFTGGFDTYGRLWDTPLQTGLPRFVSPNDYVYDVAYSPDGKYVATASQTSKDAKLWDAYTGALIREFKGHADLVQSVAFSPDGRYLLTGGGNADNTARLWDVQTGEQLRLFNGNPQDNGLNVAFSPDGRYVVTAGRSVYLWDANTGQKLREFAGHTDIIQGVTFSGDGRRLLTTSWDGTARIWDVDTGKNLLVLQHASGTLVFGAAFSPDGRFVLTGGTDNTLHLWDAQTGAKLRDFVGHGAAISSIAFSADGRYALSGSADATARLWDVATGKELRRFVGHTAGIEAVAYSPDGRYVLTGSDDGTAQIWFVDYHDVIHYLCAHLPRDLSPDERAKYNIEDQGPTCPAG